MSGRRLRPLVMVATAALAIAGALGAPAEAQPPSGDVSFSTPTLFPRFRPGIHDYVVRCNDGPVTVNAHASGGWRAAIGNHPFRSGDFSQVVPLSTGQAFVVTVRKTGQLAALPLLRALPAGQLPQIHLHPLWPGVAGVLLGGPRLHRPAFALRDDLRLKRGADLVDP